MLVSATDVELETLSEVDQSRDVFSLAMSDTDKRLRDLEGEPFTIPVEKGIVWEVHPVN